MMSVKATSIPCPCCKRAVQVPTLEIVVDHCKLPPLQARILGAVWRGKGQPVQTAMIVAAMDRGVDGRSHTYDEMKVALHHLRKRLKIVGIAIPNAGYARGYRIVFGEQ
jgi:hypothetical protein